MESFPPLAQAFRSVVEARRSCRIFTEEKIPEAVVRDCLRLALLAPNSSNLQPWEFHWIRSEEKKKLIAEYCLGQKAATTAQELIVCVARVDRWREMNGHMLTHLKTLPKVPPSVWLYYSKGTAIAYTQGFFSLFGLAKWCLATLYGFFRPITREPLSNAEMRVWATKSTALACENLMLAFSAHGYDTCPMEGMDSKRIKRLLGLPRSCAIPMVISAGRKHPKGIYSSERIRFDEKLFIKEV